MVPPTPAAPLLPPVPRTALRHRGRCGGSGGVTTAQEPCNINTVAVLRFGRVEAEALGCRRWPLPSASAEDAFDADKDAFLTSTNAVLTHSRSLYGWAHTGEERDGGLHNSAGALLVGRRSDAADTVARGTCRAPLASHTDIFDRHITLVPWSMVGGLAVDLALSANEHGSVALCVLPERASDP